MSGAYNWGTYMSEAYNWGTYMSGAYNWGTYMSGAYNWGTYMWGLNINRWFTANKLTLNMTKTEFMLIGSRHKLNNLPSLNINNLLIKHSQCSKSLGVLIDESVT